MKFLRLSLLAASVSGLLLFSACGGGKDPEKPIEQVNLGLMSKTWELTEVKLGNTTPTGYDNMEITISGTYSKTPGTEYDYSITGLPTGTGSKTPWPRANNTAATSVGKWKFDDTEPEATVIRVSDGLPMSYTVTETTLVISFAYSGAGFRTGSVEGAWQFTFAPKP